MRVSEIDSPMDTSLEDAMQGFDIEGGTGTIMDLPEEEDEDENEDIIIIDHKMLEEVDLESDLQHFEVPLEVTDYINSLTSETRKLEEELKECDDLLKYSPRQPHVSTSLVPYDEDKELKEAAAELGLTVEEFKQKVLADMQEDSFNEEDVDKEYEEFLAMQKEFEELRNVTTADTDKKILALEGPSNTEEDDTSNALALIPPSHSSVNGTDLSVEDEGTALVKYQETQDEIESNSEDQQIALRRQQALTAMRDYILSELHRNEVMFQKKQQHLVESIESLRHEEEKSLLQVEERKKWVDAKFNESREALLLEREKKDADLDRELKEKQEQTTQELQLHQVEIEKLSAALSEERHQFEKSQREWEDKLAQTQGAAALRIQKVYRGYRTRKQRQFEIRELNELRELRREEKYKLRVMELDYEIKLRDEQAQKEKAEEEKRLSEEAAEKERREEERRRDAELKRKEDEERIAEAIRVEKEKMEERDRLKRKKEQEEEERKEAERKLKEEEKKKKEEEKRLKEEEKKRQKEEEKRKKEEEKKRKEDEKKKKEEEKKAKLEEDRKKKQEEQLLKEEQKAKLEDAKISKDGLSEDNKKMYEQFVTKDDSAKHSANITPPSKHTELKPTNAVPTDETPTLPSSDVSTKQSSTPSISTQSASQLSQPTEVPQSNATNNSKTSHTPQQDKIAAVEKVISVTETTHKVTTPAKATNSLDKTTGSEITPEAQSKLDIKLDITTADIDRKPTSSSPQMSSTTSATKPTTTAAPPIEALPLSMNELPVRFPTPPPPKPSAAELKRLGWMKKCVPWSKVSNEPWKLSRPGVKAHKKPASAKRLPAVSEAIVLDAAQAETLRQVSSVTLSDLPGCSLSTLSQCWSLRYLTVTRCGLVSLDGLSQCRHLLYVDARHNQLEYVELRDLGSVQVALLSHNNLASVHGLEGCVSLRWLDVSHNCITRIGEGLTPLRRLHTLDLSHNQLVNCRGVEVAVTLQTLRLDHNFLQAVDGLEKMCLLLELSLVGNNLLQVPELTNQVLLQSLDVSENSIKSLTGLSQFWLPLLHTLHCGGNLLESCEGTACLPLLETLDVTSNQITDLESLDSFLKDNNRLNSLKVEGNPLVDVIGQDYCTEISKSLPSLKLIDGQPIQPALDGRVASDGALSEEFLQMCVSQINLHTNLKGEFDSRVKSLQTKNKSPEVESLCSTYFAYCDTSYKMACEHRSAHEYGDVSVAASLDQYSSSNTKDNTCASNGGVSSSTNSSHNMSTLSGAAGTHRASIGSDSVPDRKALFDHLTTQHTERQNGDVTQGDNNSSNSAIPVQPSTKVRRPDSSSSSSSSALSTPRAKPTQENRTARGSIDSKSKPTVQGKRPSLGQQLKGKQGLQTGSSSLLSKSNASRRKEAASRSSSLYSDSDSDDDVASYRNSQSTASSLTYPHVPHPPSVNKPAPASYINEKDKFEMALDSTTKTFSAHTSKSGKTPPQTQNQASSFYTSGKDMFEKALNNTSVTNYSQSISQKDMFEAALQNTTQQNGRDKFNSLALQGSQTESFHNKRGSLPIAGIPANVVGSQLAQAELGYDADFDLSALGLGGDLDLDGLDFDIDKYLDMGEIDEFLEKGWRPEDSPQIPHSNYPVLGKINPAVDDINTNNSATPGRPPHPPTLAWRNTPSAELKGRSLQSPAAQVASLPMQPSPSPSSVASAAETLGGGTVKSKKDELLDEWGFKDSHTAELMMARAKKMKWNAERKKKLSRLDPKQRLQLFRKLEESGKIAPVRRPPAKVLPRKEYFQAREDEAQRQQLEKRVEEHTRVNRTFEWLHTQVGDYQVASSRINAGQAPMYATNGAAIGRDPGYYITQEDRKWSPGSDHHESVSRAGVRPGRRCSIGDSQYSGQTPSLPPIKVGSAPSSHKGERISFRDTPVEKSGGWGGGKRRGQKK